jgi:peptidylprolyl isomerase
VARVKTLTRRGYYDNNLFYRVIDKFVSQTGDKGTKTYTSDLPNLKAEFTFTGKPADYVSVGAIEGGDVGFSGAMPIRLEGPANGPVKGWVNFCPGVAGMTHRDDPNTANSQIFFLRYAAGLDKDFTAFGRVIVGEDAVQAMAVGEPPAHPDKMLKVRLLSDVPAAGRPQVQVMDTKSPAFTALAQKVMGANRNFTLCDIELPTQVR